MRITGTFLDEITHDIPSQNWGPVEWAEDFDAMKAVGIDTVILIRAGYKDLAAFDSKVLRERMGALPVREDLVDMFLAQAERCGMDFYFGTYDSGRFWTGGDYAGEAELNKAFCEEAARRYGGRRAFKGWYISHEINAYDEGMMRVYEDLSRHLRSLKQAPILISPYIKGVKQFGEGAVSFETHVAGWETVCARLEGQVDILAFQDGHVALRELPRYLAAHREIAAKHGIRCWSNVECFDRDMPIKFPPIDFRKLRYKLERAEGAKAEKVITFEFSHFMSPNSAYPAARALHRRYREWLGLP
ncbi:MAG TPA: DUF4434 domain-containing protein [Elusimicrobia bacterium]|nr:DUF4434 domain-containing protein [Elusimicrobiota bacterium]